jgi:antitoxin MazE
MMFCVTEIRLNSPERTVQVPRVRKPSGGRRASKTCQIRLPGLEGRRWAILKKHEINTAVAGIGPDGLTTDEYHKVPTTAVFDEQAASVSPVIPSGPVWAVVSDRGTVTIPTGMRQRYRMQPGSPVLFEDRGGEIVIRPAEITPRRSELRQTLDALLDQVTPENTHGETDTGPAVGRESW